MIYLKEFAKSAGILLIANIFYILVTFLSLGLIFSPPPPNSLPFYFLPGIIAPAILFIFAFRAWRLYQKQGTAVMATSVATLLVYAVMVFLLSFSNLWFSIFNIFGFYTFPIIQNYENNSFASRVKISSSKVCIVRDSSTDIADVGTSTFSIPRAGIEWGFVWDGLITTSERPIEIYPMGLGVGGTVFIETPENSGTYVSLGTLASIPAYISDGKAHKLRITSLIAHLKGMPMGQEVTIEVILLNSTESALYTIKVPDKVISVLIANASSTESTPYTFCDSL